MARMPAPITGEFPKTINEMTAEWLTGVLRTRGLLRTGRVTGFETRSVGAGMLGDSIRLALSYDTAEDGPASLVAKFASPNEESRQTGLFLGIYEKEVRFYRELAPTVDVRAPGCHFAGIVPETGEFLILMEDLSPARGGDQLKGGSLDDARQAMIQAAALHGPRWNDPALLKEEWLGENLAVRELVHASLPDCIAEFHRRYEGQLSASHMAICEKVVEASLTNAPKEPRNFTITHGDFRLDNMLFDIKGGAEPLAIVDWQTPTRAPGAVDVAYYLTAGLSVDLRRRHEDELLALYLDELARHGVRGYTMDTLRQDCREQGLHGAMTAVFASVKTGRTERGDAMFLRMAEGGCQFIEDHDCLALFN